MEIGGYFGLEKLQGEEYWPNFIKLNSARACLLYLIKARAYKKIYIPNYLCYCVEKACKLNNIKVGHYDIDDNLRPSLNLNLKKDEAIYIVNYFGLIKEFEIELIYMRYKNIIVDNVQAFFTPPFQDVDTLYSVRKWFGVPDGAYLSTNAKLPYELKKEIGSDKFTHLFGRYENTATEFYEQFQIADKSFEKAEILGMSAISENLLKAIDYENAIKIRRNNFNHLHNKLKTVNSLNVSHKDCLFFYPLYCENSEIVKERLIKNKVYVPTLWSEILTENNKHTNAYNFTKNIIALPIDQRYSLEHMDIMLDLLGGL